jgi:hypothetical protein
VLPAKSVDEGDRCLTGLDAGADLHGFLLLGDLDFD